MSILSRLRDRSERLPLPTEQEIRHMLDVIRMDEIRGEALADLFTPHLPAVDVQAQVDSWEYDKKYRPWEYRRRLEAIESRSGGAAA